MNETVKALLKEYGNSTALAAKLGVTSRAVEHWATGVRTPRPTHRAALLRLAARVAGRGQDKAPAPRVVPAGSQGPRKAS